MKTKHEKIKKFKSFYKDNGLELNAEGLEVQREIEKVIKNIYCKWLDKGYSPSECREMLLTGVWIVVSFVNAMRSE